MQPSTPQPHADELTAHAAAALRSGDRVAARRLLAAALGADPRSARAWLWLSGAVESAAEQRYCLERAAGLDPQLEAARRGLAALAHVAPVRPALLDAAQAAPAAPRPPAVVNRPQPAVQSPPAVVNRPQPVAPSPPAVVNRPQPVAQRPSSSPVPYINPWVWIWLRPREAMRSAIRGRSLPETALLGGLEGVCALLTWAALRGLGAQAPAAMLLLLALVVGPIVGLSGLVMAGVLLRGAGRWLGGQGGSGEVRAGLAWAGLPLLAGLPLWLVQLALLPAASFGGEAPAGVGLVLATICGAIHAGLWLWAALLAILGVAEAHRFGPLRGALTWVLSVVMVLAGSAAILAGAAVIIKLRS